MEKIDFENKKTIRLTNKLNKSHEKAKYAAFAEKMLEDKYANDKKYCKVRDNCHYKVKYRSAARSTCILKYSTLTEIHLVFHNGSNCNYHFIIKEIQSFS